MITTEPLSDSVALGFSGLLNRAEGLPASLLSDLLNAVSDFVGTVNAEGEFMFLNPAGRRLLEIPQEEDVRGLSVLSFNELPTEDIKMEMDRVIVARKHEWSGTNVFVTRSGKRIPMSQSVVAHITDGVRCYSTIARDITEQIKAEQELRWAAEHDPLTGLWNRASFRCAVEAQRSRAAVLVVLELEDFKQVNDVYGHHVGDQVLQRAAWVLTDTLGDRGITSRFGGDEFVATIFAGFDPSPESIIESLKVELHRHLTIFGVGIRLGTAELNLDGEPLDVTLQMADLNLQAIKKEDRSAVVRASGDHRDQLASKRRRSQRHPR